MLRLTECLPAVLTCLAPVPTGKGGRQGIGKQILVLGVIRTGPMQHILWHCKLCEFKIFTCGVGEGSSNIWIELFFSFILLSFAGEIFLINFCFDILDPNCLGVFFFIKLFSTSITASALLTKPRMFVYSYPFAPITHENTRGILHQFQFTYTFYGRFFLKPPKPSLLVCHGLLIICAWHMCNPLHRANTLLQCSQE